jgi:hypothetical protein
MRSKAYKKKRATRRHRQSGGGGPDFSELGEGRSKSIYIEPLVKDTAVLISFFNPARFRRTLNNACYIIKILREKKIPCYVAECVFNDEKPQIAGADLVVRSNSYMFYKEQLINKLEKIVPENYTKLVALDGDIMFDCPDWIDQISVALDKCDVIQPFLKACWLTPDNKRVRSWKYGQSYALLKNIEITKQNLHEYHPGFAWAFRRDVFRKLGGLYPNAIIGSGDSLFTFCFYKNGIPDFWMAENRNGGALKAVLENWPEYHANFKRVNPKLGHLTIKCLHLFHGLMQNLQYNTRYNDFLKHGFESWTTGITYNKDGITEFTDPKQRNALLEFFKSRNEDISLKEAVGTDKRGTRKIKHPALKNLNQNTPNPVLD